MKKLIALCPLLFALFACSGTTDEVAIPTIQEMFADAYTTLDTNNYEEAANKFLEIDSSYPASTWAPVALEMAAYSQFESENFAETLSTIDRFTRFHPGHKDVAYMMYLKGMCFYRQVSDVRREPGMSNYALNAFNQLTQRFPDSEYAKNAQNKITILKNYIAGKIMYSARRELKRQNYPVAITEMQRIILSMQDTQMTAEAMFRLNEAYTALGLTAQANGYRDMLKANFPNSEWSQKL